MFKRVFIASKDGYGRDIKKEVLKILKEKKIKKVGIKGKPDLAILIGGDGTFLKNQSKLSCPLLGINPGESVGYYMKAGKKDFRKKILKVLKGKKNGDFFIHKLMRLETKINRKGLEENALNDVFVNPVYSRKIFRSEVTVKGKKSREKNSGVLVYTPTGSNAFARAAGAKVLRAKSKEFGVIGVAPYSGRLKKEILLSTGEVKIKCISRAGEVCVDGQKNQFYRIKEGDIVTISKSGLPAKVIGFSKKFG